MSSSAETELVASVPKGLFIDGRWRSAEGDAVFAVEDPATGAPIAHVADGSPTDALEALAAADMARLDWMRAAPRERGDILRRAFELVTERAEQFALLITLEMGKPIAEARGEVAYAADFLRWFSEEAVRIPGRYATSPDGRSRLLVARRPVGPCLLITPWNFPLAMATRKVAPAVAAGCTMVLKPAEATPLTAALFVSVMQEAGLPGGVLNLHQTSAADASVSVLLKDQRLRKVSFTGSTAVGRHLLAGAARNVLRTSMELGGNAPFLVFEDADIGAAVDGAMIAKMRNMGEACTAANRFIVHQDVAQDFAVRLAERMAGLTIGRGTDPSAQVGPMIDRRAREKISALVKEAVDFGVEVVTGGETPEGPGYFYPPTVLRGVPANARILHEEIFGPVAPIVTFGTEGEAIAAANDTEYGLAAYVYTTDLGRALRMSEQLETGMLGVNAGAISNAAAPFGGVKQSGMGREGGSEGIEEYLSVQYIGIPDPYAAL